MARLCLIIPTYNPAPYLDRLIQSVEEQTLRPDEIVIVDSSSSDGSAERLRKWADRFISIDPATFDHGGTRRLAAAAASGDILLFLTQDALPATQDAFERLVAFLESDPKMGAAYGRQIPYDETNLFGKHLRLFNYPETSCVKSLEDADRYGIKTPFLSDSFAAYKKEALAGVGSFGKKLIACEDLEVGARLLKAGYTIGYCAEAAVYHSHSYSVKEEFMRYFDIGVFHAEHPHIRKEFAAAEGEGGRYVRSELAYLLRHKAFWLLPHFFVRNLAKYAGYKLGLSYKKLPRSLARRLSMHKSWW